MATLKFLSNETLWTTIQEAVGRSRAVSAAIAYLGQGATDLLPLRKGHRLVVNMSLNAVKNGVTDPKEVRKFMRRGVEVFSRAKLHTKIILADQLLIASSANVSHNSRKGLDEAGMATNDVAARARALTFFERLCGEPVRDEYLKKCLKAYRPPKFQPGSAQTKSRAARVVEARVWFVGGLTLLEPNDTDSTSLAMVEDRARSRLLKPKGTEVSWIRYRKKPKFFDQIRDGDWVVRTLSEEDGVKRVHPPAQVLGRKLWKSSRGTPYHLMLLEVPCAGEELPWSQFRRRIQKSVPSLDNARATSQPIWDEDAADRLLRLWTSKGKVATRA